MTATARLWLCLLMVGVLYGLHVGLKTQKIFRNATWNDRDEVGQFWSETAFHYRFAKFFAEHPVRDWGQLARDRQVQFPDTINDWAEFTVAMEVPVGLLYRWWQPALPLHVFVVWYDCLVSSLTLFAVFFLARSLWRSDGAGLAASLLYGTLYPSYGRTVKNLFLREDFALPLIVFALCFSVRALQDRRTRDQIFAAGFWLAALASWHLTQFVLAVGVGAAILVYLGYGTTPRLPWFVLLLAAGSVLIPVLRAKQLYASPTMCALFALALAVWINGGRKRTGLIFAGGLAGLLTISAWLPKSYGEYAHVYQLFFYKLRYLGVKPAAPAALAWEARCLWEGPFDTATAGEFWHSLQWCLPLTVVAGWKLGRMEVGKNVFVLFTLLLVPLAWMVIRYFTFLGFATAVVAAGLITHRIGWRVAVGAAAAWQLAMLNFTPFASGSVTSDHGRSLSDWHGFTAPLPRQVAPDHYHPLIDWIRTATPSNAVVLANIADAPVILACTGRPIILHSKFENHEIRERYREFLAALYGSEEQFAEFAGRYGADYFVFDGEFLIPGPDSPRFKADRLGNLNPDCAAMLFALAPQRLRHFELQFVGRGFAVFRVLR